MESFYVPPGQISDTGVIIHSDELHHLSRVLRKKVGDHILVVDGIGTAYECTIETIGKSESRCSIRDIHPALNEPAVEVSLMLPVLKNHTRIEWIVEKGTELGVRRFIPIHTERTVPHRIRYDRLRKIALTSMKQCRRSYLPEIVESRNLENVLGKVDVSYDKVFVGHEGAPVSASMRGIQDNLSRQRVLLLAGPEGGFSDSEVDACERNGAHVVSIGVRRYRAETAALIMAVYIIHD